jgi:hypothetical protein
MVADCAVLQAMKKALRIWLAAALLGVPAHVMAQNVWLEAEYRQDLRKKVSLQIAQAYRTDFSDQGRAFLDVKLHKEIGKQGFFFYECRTNQFGSQNRNTFGMGIQDDWKIQGRPIWQYAYTWRFHDDDQAFRQSLVLDRKWGRLKPRLKTENWYRPFASDLILRRWRVSGGVQINPKGPWKMEIGVLKQWEYGKRGGFQSSFLAGYGSMQWRLPSK